MNRLRRLVDAWADLPGRVSVLANRVGELRPYVPPPPPAPAPFVCAIIEGETEDGARRACGCAAHAKDGRVLLETTSQVPLRNLRVTVFCDLERVQVHGIFCGTDLCTVALGECPVAYFDAWHVGWKLRIQCLVR